MPTFFKSPALLNAIGLTLMLGATACAAQQPNAPEDDALERGDKYFLTRTISARPGRTLALYQELPLHQLLGLAEADLKGCEGNIQLKGHASSLDRNGLPAAHYGAEADLSLQSSDGSVDLRGLTTRAEAAHVFNRSGSLLVRYEGVASNADSCVYACDFSGPAMVCPPGKNANDLLCTIAGQQVAITESDNNNPDKRARRFGLAASYMIDEVHAALRCGRPSAYRHTFNQSISPSSSALSLPPADAKALGGCVVLQTPVLELGAQDQYAGVQTIVDLQFGNFRMPLGGGRRTALAAAGLPEHRALPFDLPSNAQLEVRHTGKAIDSRQAAPAVVPSANSVYIGAFRLPELLCPFIR